MLHYEGREPFEDFLKRVAVELAGWGGIANAYFMATDCGLDSYSQTCRKLKRYAGMHTCFTFVEDKLSESDQAQAGLKVKINSALEIKQLWHALMSPQNRLTAKCGCSIFVSDGQGVDIRVLPTTHKLGFE